MNFVRNFPFFCIMICMFGAIISSVLNGKAAKYVNRVALALVIILSAVTLYYTIDIGGSFVYLMGHFPAPWGNEIRAGQLEALMALVITVIAFMSVMAGDVAIHMDIEPEKLNLYYILIDLIVASILAMIYTNDLFTAYVFIEINTIAGCGLIMVRQLGKSIVTAVRYMVVSLLGSGLFLIGVTLLYTVTGHLLMQDIKSAVENLIKTGEYNVVIIVIIGLITIGLAIKSGLYPFHLWIPDAYGYSNVASSSLLSSIVSKGYIFLLIKIYFRVIPFDYIVSSKIINIVFVFGIVAIIMGSVMAIREKSLRKVIAYSSVAQIGYIYMGIGLGTKAGIIAAIFHIIAHGATKSLLFLTSSEFTEGSHSKKIDELYGLGKKFRFSSFMFSVGAFSMVGFPLLAGFISKVLFSDAAVGHTHKMFIAIFALAISTILNAIYFLRIVVILYSDAKLAEVKNPEPVRIYEGKAKLSYYFSIGLLAAINFFLGMNGQKIIDIIKVGLKHFS